MKDNVRSVAIRNVEKLINPCEIYEIDFINGNELNHES